MCRDRHMSGMSPWSIHAESADMKVKSGNHMEELVYDKKYHFWDSVSVWLDADSIIYLAVVVLIAFGLMVLISKIKHKEHISFFDFLRKYTFVCALPIFALFLIQLIASGIFVKNNIIVTFLPLLYGVVLQGIFVMIGKLMRN